MISLALERSRGEHCLGSHDSCGIHLCLLPAGEDLKLDVRLDGEVCDSGVELSLA